MKKIHDDDRELVATIAAHVAGPAFTEAMDSPVEEEDAVRIVSRISVSFARGILEEVDRNTLGMSAAVGRSLVTGWQESNDSQGGDGVATCQFDGCGATRDLFEVNPEPMDNQEDYLLTCREHFFESLGTTGPSCVSHFHVKQLSVERSSLDGEIQTRGDLLFIGNRAFNKIEDGAKLEEWDIVVSLGSSMQNMPFFIAWPRTGRPLIADGLSHYREVV